MYIYDFDAMVFPLYPILRFFPIHEYMFIYFLVFGADISSIIQCSGPSIFYLKIE